MFQLLFLHFIQQIITTASSEFSVEIISPGNMQAASPSALPITAPAIDLAVAELSAQFRGKFRLSVTYLYNNTFMNCNDLQAGAAFLTAEYYYRRRMAQNMTVFAFPGCQWDAMEIASLAAAWNQLTIVTSYTNTLFRDRKRYPNIIQAGAIMSESIADSICTLTELYHWRTIYTILDKGGRSGPLLTTNGALVNDQLASYPGSQLYTVTLDSSSTAVGSLPFASVFDDIKVRARIVVFWGHALMLRRFMIMAHERNMTGPEYVYISLAAFEYPTELLGNITWQMNDNEDDIARDAFQALIVVAPTPTSSNIGNRTQVLQQMVRLSKRDYDYNYPKNSVVLDRILDCKSESGHQDWSESAAIADEISNHSFSTSLGDFSFDETGGRIVRFDIQQLNMLTGRFETCLRQGSDHDGKSRFVLVQDIKWRGGTAPPDRPICGFLGTSGPCSSKEYDWSAVIAGLVSVAILTGVFTSCYGNRLSRNLRKLSSRAWELDSAQLIAGQPSRLSRQGILLAVEFN